MWGGCGVGWVQGRGETVIRASNGGVRGRSEGHVGIQGACVSR